MEEFFSSIPFLIFLIYIISSIVGAIGKALQHEAGKKQGPEKRQKPVQSPQKRPSDGPWWERPWWGEQGESPFPWEPQKTVARSKKREEPKKVVVSSEGSIREDVQSPKAKTEELAPDVRKGVGAVFAEDSKVRVTRDFQGDEGMKDDFDWQIDSSEGYDDWVVHGAKSDWLRSIFMDKSNVVRGIVLSEVLGPPKSRQ